MDESFLIRGGRALAGTVNARGSKNAATKMMIASLLTEEPCAIENVPQSADVDITRELCEQIGSAVSWRERTITIATPVVKNSLVPHLSRRNRIPVLALGPLLHRMGVAEVPVLGGCPIGHRPINFHVEALNKMGVTIERRESSYYAEAKEIHGEEIVFPYSSVGATENVLLVGVRAKGKTVIRNAAVEPEIINLVSMLTRMGAHIMVDVPLRTIYIDGVRRLSGAKVRVMSDRNEVVSFAAAALATKGDIFISEAEPEVLTAFLEKVNEIGGNYEIKDNGMRFWGAGPYRATAIETAPHPGFMTDWQQPFCVLLTQANAESIIHETVYEERFGYTKDLQRMGANIEVTDDCLGGNPCRFAGQTYNHSARIKGPAKLSGTEITMTDIRAGMAHLIAALVAEGESRVSGIIHVDRGYEKIDERLRALGADITRT